MLRTHDVKLLGYLRMALSVLGLGSALLLSCTQCASAQTGAVLSTPINEDEIVLRWHAACFLSKLGLAPRWNVQIDVIDDSAYTWYGQSLIDANTLEAEMRFNLYTLRRDREDLRLVALHEVLHVATSELVRCAVATDRDASLIEDEKLVRQMVRWPSWAGVCA